jgi:hypothetical protein
MRHRERVESAVMGNPRESEWFQTPPQRRHKKHLQVTLAPAERELLEKLAQKHGVSVSVIVGAASAVFAKLKVADRRIALDKARAAHPEKAKKARARTF